MLYICSFIILILFCCVYNVLTILIRTKLAMFSTMPRSGCISSDKISTIVSLVSGFVVELLGLMLTCAGVERPLLDVVGSSTSSRI